MKWGLCLAAAIAAVGLGIGVTHASGPIAVFALVDKVTLEPNAEHPDRILMSGVFILSSVPEGCGGPSNPCTTVYSKAERGYLYYSRPAQYAEQVLREWADLKSVAGTGQVVGYGSGWFKNPARLRKESEKVGAPDAWQESNNGVVKVNADRAEAKALLEFKGQ